MLSTRDIVGSFSISFPLFRSIAERFVGNEHGILAMLRSLLLIPLNQTSGRGVARVLKNDRELARACGFKNKTPDQSWIHRFRDQIADLLPEIFAELVVVLREKGVIDGKDWSVDATLLKRMLTSTKRKSPTQTQVGATKTAKRNGFLSIKHTLPATPNKNFQSGTR